MKLSELLKYRKAVRKMSTRPVEDAVHHHLGNIVTDVAESQLQFKDYSIRLSENLQAITKELSRFQKDLLELDQSIDEMVTELQPSYFAASYHWYDKDMPNENTEYILNRRLHDITPEGHEFINTRVSNYADWRYPAVIIRPGLESFTETLVGCDPLYLIDQSHDLLIPAKEKFNEKYQSRLRLLAVTESSDRPILHEIPDNQIGFFFAYNFFNFRPMEMLEKYFSEIYQKLRPGGVLGLTFNNCDFHEGVGYCENNFMCYTPGNMVLSLAEKVGFEIHFQYHTHYPNTWLELKKPGTIQSLRGGQSLAKILRKK